MDKLFYFPIFAPILPIQAYIYSIHHQLHDIITDLSQISSLSKTKSGENDRFSVFLKNNEIASLDEKVQTLNQQISQSVDCQKCGNCCKTLMIVVSENESNRMSEVLALNQIQFEEKYIEKGSNGLMIVNTMPCHFLKNNSCTVYSNRFEGCREFPALHLPDFKKRVFTHFMHYDRCPIIFNVIEQLKIDLNFEKELN